MPTTKETTKATSRTRPTSSALKTKYVTQDGKKHVVVTINADLAEVAALIRTKWSHPIASDSLNSERGLSFEGGTLVFEVAPQGLGTIVSLVLDSDDSKAEAFLELRRLKCLIETGEIATIEGQTSGREAEAKTIMKH